MKLFQLIIGMLFLSIMVVGLSLVLAEQAATYEVTGYTEDSLAEYENYYESIQNITNETQAKLDSIDTGIEAFDALGSISVQAGSAVKTAGKTVDLYAQTGTNTVGWLQLGPLGGIIGRSLGISVLVLFVFYFLIKIFGRTEI